MQDPQTNPSDGLLARRPLPGRWLVLMTLSLFLVVPAITYLTWQLTQGEPNRIKLSYDDRATWFMQPVRPRPLEYDKFVAGETGRQYRKTDLKIEPEIERMIQRCVVLAQADDFFTSMQQRDELLGIAKAEANGFYPAYLVASWYRENGDAEQAQAWSRVAFDRAGGALAQRLIDKDQSAVAEYRIPPVAIGFDRVTDGERDATLVLVYPAPRTETNGFIYLPTYRSSYRLTDPTLPLGVDPGIHPTRLTLMPQPVSAVGSKPNWFSAPDGAVGRFEDAVVTKSP